MRGFREWRARKLAASGGRLLHVDLGNAERRYHKAVALDPQLHEGWFDLGLVFKWTGRWEECFDACLRAAELVGERREEPAWWNLGIAATALHRWDVARRAWRAYGLDVPDGDGPIDADFGPGAVRLNPRTSGEVVWGQRIDPARIRLETVPLPDSGHRWGDIVLHDGQPSGRRRVDGHSHPVFDELVRWAPSDVPTVVASITAPAVEDIDTLLEAFAAAGVTAEDWTRMTRVLCTACSEGDAQHDHPQPAFDPAEPHRVGIAAPLDRVTELLDAWVAAGPARRAQPQR